MHAGGLGSRPVGRLRAVNLRKSSEVDTDFPYKSDRVCYILVMSDGSVTSPRLVGERKRAARALRDGDGQLFAAWPGQYRTDLFEIDDVEAFVNAYPPPERGG